MKGKKFLTGILGVMLVFGLVLFVGCSTDDDDGDSNGGNQSGGDAPTVTVTPGDGQLDIVWTAVSGEDGGYKVYIRNVTDAPTESHLATQTSPGALTYTAKNATVNSGLPITNGTKYYVWVKAIKGSGFSDLSTVKDGTPMAADAKPVRPAAPTITTLPSGQLRITWVAVASATGYDVVVSANDSSSQPYADSKMNITTAPFEFTTTALSSSTQYYVFVRAKNAVGDGPWSDSVSRTTVDPVASVDGAWNERAGAADTLTFTAPDSCRRDYGVGAAVSQDTYTYAYVPATGILTLTPQVAGGVVITGTVTGNVLSVPWAGGTIVYTKQ
jgi:hypothetical protein